MPGGGGDAPPPPVDDGEFLLQLLKKPPHHYHYHHHHPPPTQIQSHAQPPPPPPTPQALTHDPAVAAVGATFPVPYPQPSSSNGLSPTPPWPPHLLQQSPPPSHPPFALHGFYLTNPNRDRSPILSSASPPGINQGNFQQNIAQSKYNSPGEGVRKLGFMGTNANAGSGHLQDTEKDIFFGSLRAKALVNGNLNENLWASQADNRNLGISVLKDKRRDVGLVDFGGVNKNGVDFQQSSVGRDQRGNSSVLTGHGHQRSDSTRKGTGYWGRQGHNFNNHRTAVLPPGFPGQQMSGDTRDYPIRKESFDHIGEKGRNKFGESRCRSGKNEMERRFSSMVGRHDGDGDRGLSSHIDHPGPPGGSKLHSVSASHIEDSMMSSQAKYDLEEHLSMTSKEFDNGTWGRPKGNGHGEHSDLDDLEEHLMESLGLEDESEERSDKKKHYRRDKGYRSDKRGQWLMGQRMRQMRRQLPCRSDINRLNPPFLAIYESLIPAEEEKGKQNQLLTLLEKIVSKEWPEARLFLYGSCANSFEFLKSDIDLCLTISDADIDKPDALLKLADMLKLENLQNVQALTRARVPIVKLMDPATGISCDICINNVLAVVNTKLLRDYAQIDVRLRQLAFLVKHWAKSRVVNEPYQGTLSSYAYVLMCIHFLQHRRPAILPCLQEMKATYSETLDNVECSYYDRVENLVGFGSHNRESVAQLVWAFFNYWAYVHDYPNDVISVRRGTILSKQTKNWTRRIGNDRHLICIEDPFEIFHDLGRVVDRRSIRVLREEFVRAAEILQSDPNPCVTLFEPYVPT